MLLLLFKQNFYIQKKKSTESQELEDKLASFPGLPVLFHLCFDANHDALPLLCIINTNRRAKAGRPRNDAKDKC